MAALDNQLPGLTPQELDVLKKVFSSPLDIPAEWRAWLIAYIEANPPELPITQTFGYDTFVKDKIFVPQIAVNEVEVPFTNTAFATIAGGPTLTGLDDGQYIVIFGAALYADTGDSVEMAVRINSVGNTAAAESQAGAHVSVARAITATLNAGNGNNRIDGVYKTLLAHACDQRKGWVIAFKTANLP